MQGKLVGYGRGAPSDEPACDMYLPYKSLKKGVFGAVLAWCGAKTFHSLHLSLILPCKTTEIKRLLCPPDNVLLVS